MATKFAKGQEVKLAAVVPQGPVKALRMDEDGTICYMITWEANGVTHERWFTEEQLEAVE